MKDMQKSMFTSRHGNPIPINDSGNRPGYHLWNTDMATADGHTQVRKRKMSTGS
jgi:hypothetical protein